MRRITSCVIIVVCLVLASGAEGGVFNVRNVTELRSALSMAQGNGEDDTINVAAGIYRVSSRLEYIAVEGEDYSLTIQGAGAWATVWMEGTSVRFFESSRALFRTKRGACGC